jgi:hypothetical protein
VKGPFPRRALSFFCPIAKPVHGRGVRFDPDTGFQIAPHTWTGNMFQFCFCVLRDSPTGRGQTWSRTEFVARYDKPLARSTAITAPSRCELILLGVHIGDLSL